MRNILCALIPFMLFGCVFSGAMVYAPLNTQVRVNHLEEQKVDHYIPRPDYTNHPEIVINPGASLADINALLHLTAHYFSQDGKLHVVGMLENRSDNEYAGVGVIVSLKESDSGEVVKKPAKCLFQLWPAHTDLPFEAVFEINSQDHLQIEIDIVFQELAIEVRNARTRELVIYQMEKQCPDTGDGECFIKGVLVNDSGHLVSNAKVVATVFQDNATYIGTMTLTDIAQREEVPFIIPVYLPGAITERGFGVYLMSEGENFDPEGFLSK